MDEVCGWEAGDAVHQPVMSGNGRTPVPPGTIQTGGLGNRTLSRKNVSRLISAVILLLEESMNGMTYDVHQKRTIFVRRTNPIKSLSLYCCLINVLNKNKVYSM